MAEKQAFQAESKRLLDLMINSIYTHKEIFLRELISNASDALDKYYYYALEHSEPASDLEIRIDLNKTDRTLTLSDNGIGMSRQELEDNLGTIAKSGTLAFKQAMEKEEKSTGDIIGQFGVGFYSAFMVADKVTVYTRAAGSDEGFMWTSEGAEGYEIEPYDKGERGTVLVLHLKSDTETDKFSQYLESGVVQNLVRKYSDYIHYPIKMTVETQQMVKGTEDQETPEYETVPEERTLNSMVPIWGRPASEVSKEELCQFYKEHFHDFEDPARTIFFNVEGRVDFTALLYIPGRVPSGFYSQDYKPGLQLFSRGVFIKDDCDELLPPYLRFVKGLVDSQDLSLNISREMLQQDHQLTLIRKRIESKVLADLKSMLKNDREAYEKFWKNFGLDLKFGVYNNFGADKEKLEGLLLFAAADGQQLVTLDEYVDGMPEEQKDIYYISASNVENADQLPVVKKLMSMGRNVLVLTADIDELVLQTIGTYKDHGFKNAGQSDLDLASEQEKKELEAASEENKDLLAFMKESLPEVSEVRLSDRLVDDPVTLVAGNGMSFEMEKVYQAMASQEGNDGLAMLKADRILEVNPASPVFKLLQNTYKTDPDKAREISEVLYDEALLIEGFAVKDPIRMARLVSGLIAGA